MRSGATWPGLHPGVLFGRPRYCGAEEIRKYQTSTTLCPNRVHSNNQLKEPNPTNPTDGTNTNQQPKRWQALRPREGPGGDPAVVLAQLEAMWGQLEELRAVALKHNQVGVRGLRLGSQLRYRVG